MCFQSSSCALSNMVMSLTRSSYFSKYEHKIDFTPLPQQTPKTAGLPLSALESNHSKTGHSVTILNPQSHAVDFSSSASSNIPDLPQTHSPSTISSLGTADTNLSRSNRLAALKTCQWLSSVSLS
mmetsp:Transcript_15593/g.29591  ORF Transcript_15593/g.29591 Transcript_15593/m.29591 type:complete len:125 (-) Transcript_15593:187-561(-)